MQLSFFILLPSPFGEGFGGEAFILHLSEATILHLSYYSPRPLERGWG